MGKSDSDIKNKSDREFITVELADVSEKKRLFDLLQEYLQDLDQYETIDRGPDGSFLYPYFDLYWTEPERYPFIIKHKDECAGLALVNKFCRIVKNGHDIAEFYIKPGFRRRGFGRRAAQSIFRRFPGAWEVSELRLNVKSRSFWLEVIREYTNGRFREADVSDEKWDGYIQTFEA